MSLISPPRSNDWTIPLSFVLFFRVYGPVLYPYLTTNWQWIWSSNGNEFYLISIYMKKLALPWEWDMQ
jgi:hypothetical protein